MEAPLRHCFISVFEGPMFQCSNSNCGNGGWFHPACVGVSWENIPKDDDVYCSNGCRISGRSRLCTCKEIANQDDMIMCDNASACIYGVWFHYTCVGISSDEIPGTTLPRICICIYMYMYMYLTSTWACRCTSTCSTFIYIYVRRRLHVPYISATCLSTCTCESPYM